MGVMAVLTTTGYLAIGTFVLGVMVSAGLAVWRQPVRIRHHEERMADEARKPLTGYVAIRREAERSLERSQARRGVR
jgi:hypothetical protein